MSEDLDWELLSGAIRETADDIIASIRNARVLAQKCREENESIMPLAAAVSQELASMAGMKIEVGGMTGGALAELIDHLATKAEQEINEHSDDLIDNCNRNAYQRDERNFHEPRSGEEQF